MDFRAHSVLNVGLAHRPPVGVLRNYVATKSDATKEIEDLLLPSGAPLVLADFGRTQFAAVLAASTGLAAATTRMGPTPRFNSSRLVGDVAAILELPAEEASRFKLGLSQTASSVVNRAYYFIAAFADRPDVFYDELAGATKP